MWAAELCVQGWEEVRLQGSLSRVIGLSESVGSCKEAHYPQLRSMVLPVSTVELSHVCAQAGVHTGIHVQTCKHGYPHSCTCNMPMYAYMGMHSSPVCAALLVRGHLGNLPKTPYQLGQVSVSRERGQGPAPSLPPTAEFGPEPVR